jgi:hypothetical protein
MDNIRPAVKDQAIHGRLIEIANGRPIPRDRTEAALFGYTEDDWQAMLDAVKPVTK